MVHLEVRHRLAVIPRSEFDPRLRAVRKQAKVLALASEEAIQAELAVWLVRKACESYETLRHVT
jgi:hypothetical protein